jgi:hypothetical protein
MDSTPTGMAMGASNNNRVRFLGGPKDERMVRATSRPPPILEAPEGTYQLQEVGGELVYVLNQLPMGRKPEQ